MVLALHYYSLNEGIMVEISERDIKYFGWFIGVPATAPQKVMNS